MSDVFVKLYQRYVNFQFRYQSGAGAPHSKEVSEGLTTESSVLPCARTTLDRFS